MWLLKLLSRLPLCVLYAISHVIYFIIYHVVRVRRHLVYANLTNSFPDKTPIEIKQIARQSYKNLSLVFVEILKGYTISSKDIVQRAQLTNPEVIRQFIANQQSIIIVCAHQCNWEWALLALSCEIPSGVDVVYQPLHIDAFEKFFFYVRSRFGANLIPMKNFIFEIMKRRNTAKCFVIAADQTPLPGEKKHWTRFLNQDTAFYIGQQIIARRMNVPVIFCNVQRIRTGYYSLTFKVLAQPPYPKNSYEIVESYAREVELWIQRSPEDWLWIYRKWKYKKPLYA